MKSEGLFRLSLAMMTHSFVVGSCLISDMRSLELADNECYTIIVTVVFLNFTNIATVQQGVP
jgi:hypothetical protein